MDSPGTQRNPVLIRFADVLERVGMRKSYVFAAIKAGTFPPPTKRGRTSLFVSTEIDAWIEARIAERDGKKAKPCLLATEKELADALNVSVSYLQKDRLGKKKIPFIKLGDSVRYDIAVVREALVSMQQGGAR